MQSKKQIGILGGAMNPITIGHIELAKTVLEQKIVNSVWIMPCYQHMYNKNMESEKHRLEMCDIAVQCYSRILVSDYEIKNELRGETYQLIKRLIFGGRQYDFSVIIGLDNANTFDKWVNYKELERMARFIVVPRKGVKRDTSVNWYLKPPHIYLSSDHDIPNISSTVIRDTLWSINDIKANYENYDIGESEDFLNENLPKGVLDYIRENGLYI